MHCRKERRDTCQIAGACNCTNSKVEAEFANSIFIATIETELTNEQTHSRIRRVF